SVADISKESSPLKFGCGRYSSVFGPARLTTPCAGERFKTNVAASPSLSAMVKDAVAAESSSRARAVGAWIEGASFTGVTSIEIVAAAEVALASDAEKSNESRPW